MAQWGILFSLARIKWKNHIAKSELEVASVAWNSKNVREYQNQNQNQNENN